MPSLQTNHVLEIEPEEDCWAWILPCSPPPMVLFPFFWAFPLSLTHPHSHILSSLCFLILLQSAILSFSHVHKSLFSPLLFLRYSITIPPSRILNFYIHQKVKILILYWIMTLPHPFFFLFFFLHFLLHLLLPLLLVLNTRYFHLYADVETEGFWISLASSMVWWYFPQCFSCVKHFCLRSSHLWSSFSGISFFWQPADLLGISAYTVHVEVLTEVLSG